MHEPDIRVEWVGAEREPVVVVDDFVAEVASVAAAATSSSLRDTGDYYPGRRAVVDAAYLSTIGPTMGNVLREFFGARRGVQVLRAYYSLATTLPAQLAVSQRIPHVDAYDSQQIALVHFLGEHDLGGTAFFRQRSTGFETVDTSRRQRYHEALAADLQRHGEPPPEYIGMTSPLFERTHVCPPRCNRAIFFRGTLLHCAALDGVHELPGDPRQGRLTVAGFLKSLRE
jgi:hypothetical protein